MWRDVREWNSSLLCWWRCRGYVPYFKQFLGAFAKLRKATVSFVMSVHLSFLPHGTTRIFVTFDIWGFFEHLSRKFEFHSNPTRVKRTLHEDQYTLLIISRSYLIRTRNVSDKRCRENQNTILLYSLTFFSKTAPLWDNVEKCFRAGQTTDDNMARAHFMLDT
jgi:hypothetical protein